MPQNRGAAVSLRIRGYDVVASAAMGAPLRLSLASTPRFGARSTARSISSARARLRQRPIGELSGGERQRLLLSQALIGRPKLLLLDEPLISLDPAQQTAVVELARRLRDELKLAIVFSAHELNPLVNRIDRVLYLGAGAAVLGAVDEVVTAPVLSKLYRADIEVVQGARPLFRDGGRRRGRARRASARRDGHPGMRTRITIARGRRRCSNMISCARRFAASGVAAVLAGFVGYFLVLRGQTFAGHALSHVGFTGATGAALFGVSPLAGLVGFTLLAGIGMGLLGEKLSERDVAIGMTLSLALGLGLLFLHFYTSAATRAAALLFGNVLGVDDSALWTLVVARRRRASRRWPISRGRCCSPRCRRNSPRRGACRCARSRSPSWRSSPSRSPNVRRSSACCWCSR